MAPFLNYRKIMTVKVLKAINGEDIIANVKADTDSGYKVEDPAVIMLQQSQDGNIGVSIAPFMPYAREVWINKNGIMAEGLPDVNLENEYNRLFGSGIVVAPAGSIR